MDCVARDRCNVNIGNVAVKINIGGIFYTVVILAHTVCDTADYHGVRTVGFAVAVNIAENNNRICFVNCARQRIYFKLRAGSVSVGGRDKLCRSRAVLYCYIVCNVGKALIKSVDIACCGVVNYSCVEIEFYFGLDRSVIKKFYRVKHLVCICFGCGNGAV